MDLVQWRYFILARISPPTWEKRKEAQEKGRDSPKSTLPKEERNQCDIWIWREKLNKNFLWILTLNPCFVYLLVEGTLLCLLSGRRSWSLQQGFFTYSERKPKPTPIRGVRPCWRILRSTWRPTMGPLRGWRSTKLSKHSLEVKDGLEIIADASKSAKKIWILAPRKHRRRIVKEEDVGATDGRTTT